jgi:hypothetical protein
MDFEDFMFRALGVILLISIALFILFIVALVVRGFNSSEIVDVCQYCGAVLGGAVG